MLLHLSRTFFIGLWWCWMFVKMKWQTEVQIEVVCLICFSPLLVTEKVKKQYYYSYLTLCHITLQLELLSEGKSVTVVGIIWQQTTAQYIIYRIFKDAVQTISMAFIILNSFIIKIFYFYYHFHGIFLFPSCLYWIAASWTSNREKDRHFVLCTEIT